MSYLQTTLLAPRDGSPGGAERLEDLALDWLASARKNGQVWGEPLMAWEGGKLWLTVSTPCRDSLDPGHHSPGAERDHRRLCEATEDLRWQVRGEGRERSDAEAWSRCPSFTLFTHAFDRTSPLCAGDDGQPVPLYLLPLEPRLREDLVAWMGTYQDHDRVWLDSGALEAAAHRELAELRSELARRGRGLAGEVERALARPVYYLLHRGEAEERGPCPGCRGPWERGGSSEARGARGLDRFDMRCDACRLVAFASLGAVEEPAT